MVNNPLSQIDPSGFLNAFLQEICSSGFNPWAPEMQANAVAEMCFRSMSFTEASENGWLVGMALHQAQQAGCLYYVMMSCSAQEENRKGSRNMEIAASAGASSHKDGVVKILPGNPSGAEGRALFDAKLAELRSEGAISQPGFLQRLFGLDKFKFYPVYGSLSDTGAAFGYSTAEKAEQNGTHIGGKYKYGGINIFLGAAHRSMVPTLGSGVLTPEETMEWILLHEYGHHRNSGGDEKAADDWAKRYFRK